MPTSIKVLPPERLPEGELTEQDFQTYQTELEVFLQLDEKFHPFFPGGAYESWEAGENGGERLTQARRVGEVDDTPQKLVIRNMDLRLFLSLIAKTLPKSRYGTVMQHCTSLKWVYNQIRQDYDIQARGIHVLNILDLKFDKSTMKPIGFYNQYRSVVMNNMAQRDDPIKYKNKVQASNETIGPCFEDIIFINVLTCIDARLPRHIKSAYAHKLGEKQRLMDFKGDILVNIPKFLEEMEEKEQLSAMRVETASLAAFQTGGRGSGKGNYRGGAGAFATRGYPPGGLGRGFGRGAQGGTRPPNQTGAKEKKSFCWSCWDKDKGRSVYNSHNMGEKTCPTGSHLGNVNAEEEGEGAQDQQPQPWELGTDDDSQDANLVPTLQQVPANQPKLQNLTRPPDNTDLDQNCACMRCIKPTFSFGRIKAEPTQILTVFVDSSNNQPIHIDLDSGANVGFISLAAVKRWGFKMTKCSQ